MGRFEDYRRRDPRFERLGPARRAQTPPITGAKPSETDLGVRRRQVVANRGGELEKLGGDHRAHGVHAVVIATGVAAPVPEPARERVMRTGLEFLAQYALRHVRSLAYPPAPKHPNGRVRGADRPLPSRPAITEVR